MKNLLLVLSLVITASPAFASRARLESLGEGKNGSYYINDGRNIFLNPASINGYKKKLFLELGAAAGTTDTLATQKVQGGFTNTFGDFVYGIYMGKESDRLLTAANGATGVALGLIAPDHSVDFFFGGETSSFKYGLGLIYAGALLDNNTAKDTASALGLRAGIDINSFSFFHYSRAF